jgi:hypothetical protein
MWLLQVLQHKQDYDEFIYEIKPVGDFVNYYRSQMQSAQTKDARDSAAIALNTAYNIYQTSIDRFITRRKSSPVSALLLAFSYDMDPNKDVALLEKRFNMLDSSAMQNRYASGVKNVIEGRKDWRCGHKGFGFYTSRYFGKKYFSFSVSRQVCVARFLGKLVWSLSQESPNVVEAYNQYKE